MHPEGVIQLEIRPILFNDRKVKALYIDLNHINMGKDRIKRRSDLTVDFVKSYRIVFCQDYSFSWIGVITLYRIKENHEK